MSVTKGVDVQSQGIPEPEALFKLLGSSLGAFAGIGVAIQDGWGRWIALLHWESDRFHQRFYQIFGGI